MREFLVNEHISLKLEDGKTVIYIDGILFRQCKYILLANLKFDDINGFIKDFSSIDEESEKYNHSLEGEYENLKLLSPEEEFQAHCSNLQIWAENNYDTCLLHSNLAFPLLKRLYDVGDIKARSFYKEEVVKRFSSGYLPTALYLVKEYYLDSLEREELELCFLDVNLKLCNNIIKEIDNTKDFLRIIFPIIQYLAYFGDSKAKELVEINLKNHIERSDLPSILRFIVDFNYDFVDKNYFRSEWLEEKSELRNYIITTLRDEKFHKGYPSSYREFPFELITIFDELEVPDEKNFICYDIFKNVDLNNNNLVYFLITEGLMDFFPKDIIQKWIFSNKKYTELYQLYR